MGRLWQTLILSRWKPLLAWLPVETGIRDRQADYYAALAASDKAGESSAFIGFMLAALLHAIEEAAGTDQVSDQVKALLKCLAKGPQTALACMKKPGTGASAHVLQELPPACAGCGPD